MTFGILDDHRLDRVPGTGLLSAKAGRITSDAAAAMGLKRATGKHSHIVLIPQPSDDPFDPLNWPRWKKEACFWTLVFTTSVADALWAIVTPGYVQLSREFHVSLDEVASSFAASLPGLAAFTLVQSVLAVKYGHRILYLVSTLVMFLSCMWSALSPNLGSLRASRVIQGIAEAAPKCTVAVTIQHLYFVHERGTRMSIWSLLQVASAITGGLINSYVIQNLSWQMGFWFISITCGLSFVGVIVFVPETTYRRDQTLKPVKSRNLANGDNIDENTRRMSATSDADMRKLGWQPDRHPNTRTYLSHLKIYNGTYSDESIWRLFLQPFPFLLSPTWFIFLSYAMPMVLLNVVSLCTSAIFTLEHGFDTAQNGLTNLAGLVGIALAMVFTGPLHDWGIVWTAQRNHGVYEPEFRLVLTMFSMLVGVFGYVGWAIGNDHHMPWIGPVACITMLYFSAVVSSGTSFAYLVDTHGPTGAVHIVALANCVMVILEYGAAFCANRIVLARGVRASLLVLGAGQAVCWLAAVAMYVFGKRVRSFIARHPQFFREDFNIPAGESPQSIAGVQTEPKH